MSKIKMLLDVVEGIPSPYGVNWCHRGIMDILKNEKYVGDLLLQKYYTADHITKRSQINDGKLNKYFVADNHEPIVERDLYDKVQHIIAEKESKNPHIKSYDYMFKNMVFCEICGQNYIRKKAHGNTIYERYVWKCKTYAYNGKKCCDSKQIPDEVLTRFADEFDKEISKIIICKDNIVRFIFSDGSEETRSWEIDRKWTDDMKARNYENQRRRYL